MTIAIDGFEDFDAFGDLFEDEFSSFDEEFKNVADAVIGFNPKNHANLDGAIISLSDEPNIFVITLDGKKIGKLGIYVEEDD